MSRKTHVALGLLLFCSCLRVVSAGDTSAHVRHFEQHVRPLLEAKCLKCHGERKHEANLRLDSREALLQGGDSGPAITAGEPEASLLIEAVNYASLQMPPEGELSRQEIDHLTAWIAAGAVWPDDVEQIREVSGGITEADRQWWAFQPLIKPHVPVDPEDSWSQNPIDHFVLARQKNAGLSPAPQADPVTLVRRLYFDLIGLPPSPEEIEAFLADDSPHAWDHLIEKLLADPRYGEHWARFWLDVVRYAESDGWKADAYRPHMWRYRDYVVQAFNDDKPYPQFVREQLAGDELPGDDPQALAAASYLRLGIYEYNQRNARTHWNDILNEITDVTSDVFLGMGMSCARCHDHKFDPLLQQDYYQLRAFFEPILWKDMAVPPSSEDQGLREQQQAEWEAATSEIRSQLEALTQPHLDRIRNNVIEKFALEFQACYYKPVEERTTWDNQIAYLMERQVSDEGGGPTKTMSKEERATYDRLTKELAEFDHLKPEPATIYMTVGDAPGEVTPTRIPNGTPGTVVEPGFLTVLQNDSTSSEPDIIPRADSTGRRTALADWIGRADNPLTTRVIVNRIWQQHFGEGIVATPNDFGHLGQPPSHPELLDWLTVTFIESGWSMKDLHRLILTSATWKQSAHHPQAAANEERDPAGKLLWRWRVRRLTAEQIRDAMLSATGELDPATGGPSVKASSPRRALYVKVFRNNPDELLHLFDRANGLKSVANRDSTTTPTQSLLMINGSYALDRAKALADSLINQSDHTAADVTTEIFRRIWSRPPSSAELAQALDFLDAGAEDDASTLAYERVTDFSHLLLNTNAFLYID